ncbi:MAG: hypothetical protein WBN82_04120 [Porticoccaceae bacterium]
MRSPESIAADFAQQLAEGWLLAAIKGGVKLKHSMFAPDGRQAFAAAMERRAAGRLWALLQWTRSHPSGERAGVGVEGLPGGHWQMTVAMKRITAFDSSHNNSWLRDYFILASGRIAGVVLV